MWNISRAEERRPARAAPTVENPSTSSLATQITEVARGAVSAIGKIGVRLPDCAAIVVEQLMKFLEIDIEYVSAEAIICMQNLLRKYPAVSDRIIQGIGVFLRSVDDGLSFPGKPALVLPVTWPHARSEE